MRHLAIIFLMSCVMNAAAADKDPAKEQARRQQQAQYKLQQEKAQLAQEKAALETQLKEAGEKASAAEEKVAGAAKRSAGLAREVESLRSEREKLTSELAETRQKLEERQKELSASKGNEKSLGGQLELRGKQLAQCEQKNAMLYQHGLEMGQRLADRSFIDFLAVLEPFTGIKRVEMENVLEEYREKLDAQRLEPVQGEKNLGGSARQ